MQAPGNGGLCDKVKPPSQVGIRVSPKLLSSPHTTMPPQEGFLGGHGNEMCHTSGFSVPS